MRMSILMPSRASTAGRARAGTYARTPATGHPWFVLAWLVLSVALAPAPAGALEDPDTKAPAPETTASPDDAATTTTPDEDATAPDTTAEADASPEAVVDRLHQTLLDIMRGGERLGFDGRYETVGPVLERTFDFGTISRIVTGRYWREASEADRIEFVKTFTRLSAATYADRFSDYNGESFRVDGVEQSRSGKVVKTHIVKGSGETVPLDYVLHETDAGGWRIINVVADGVSDLSLKRADYTSVIREAGFESLIRRLDDKIRSYAAPDA